eukprot:CAMPEP_0185320252 /NCGR_PEP_ID=MMETSP1363-20130426/54191_1 /TAXON_ID=38817 /ORGANISM="Gephyrocapsa oceanica, Strain RCC1303" /LENGTH=62 /DNA_ID=CAMNT_0027918665 /DNA_START=365 /DNA_END=550 /DNA_ORIENTATION=-
MMLAAPSAAGSGSVDMIRLLQVPVGMMTFPGGQRGGRFAEVWLQPRQRERKGGPTRARTGAR